MDKPFVIRYSEEESDEEKEAKEYMVNNIVSYFTHTDPEGHRKKWKKRKKVVSTEAVDYYYV